MGNQSVKHPPYSGTRITPCTWAKLCGDPPKTTPGEYITAIDTACQSLGANTAEELRADIYRVLRL